LQRFQIGNQEEIGGSKEDKKVGNNYVKLFDSVYHSADLIVDNGQN
jgi:hypothetical protein